MHDCAIGKPDRLRSVGHEHGIRRGRGKSASCSGPIIVTTIAASSSDDCSLAEFRGTCQRATTVNASWGQHHSIYSETVTQRSSHSLLGFWMPLQRAPGNVRARCASILRPSGARVLSPQPIDLVPSKRLACRASRALRGRAIPILRVPRRTFREPLCSHSGSS